MFRSFKFRRLLLRHDIFTEHDDGDPPYAERTSMVALGRWLIANVAQIFSKATVPAKKVSPLLIHSF